MVCVGERGTVFQCVSVILTMREMSVKLTPIDLLSVKLTLSRRWLPWALRCGNETLPGEGVARAGGARARQAARRTRAAGR